MGQFTHNKQVKSDRLERGLIFASRFAILAKINPRSKRHLTLIVRRKGATKWILHHN